MIGLLAFLLVYGLVPFAVYRTVHGLSGSNALGLAAAIVSIFLAIAILERTARWFSAKYRQPH